jgi:hypothetical protein
MTLKELKQKVLVLIEEYAPDDETKPTKLTADDDIDNKMNDVINQIMYELCRIKKIPKYIEMEVTAGDVIDFEALASECGYDIYQIKLVTGVDYEARADGTILKMLDSGVAEIDVFVYPEAITRKTKDSYEFELSADVLEIMPYGVAADLLSTDVSSNYKEFKERYETMLMRLETRNHLPAISIVGGINV